MDLLHLVMRKDLLRLLARQTVRNSDEKVERIVHVQFAERNMGDLGFERIDIGSRACGEYERGRRIRDEGLYLRIAGHVLQNHEDAFVAGEAAVLGGQI